MKKLALHELNRLTSEQFKQSKKLPIAIYADHIRSGHNIGSFFRIADSFSFESIYLGGYSAVPPHPEIAKTAIGSSETVDWQKIEDDIIFLNEKKTAGYFLVAVEQTTHSIPLDKFAIEPNHKYILVFGNEVNGVSQQILDLCDVAIEIPQLGTKHSLNVSVAAGIVCWEFAKKYF